MTSSSLSSRGLLAGHLGVGDRGQHHPQGRRPQLVARLDRGGQVGAQAVLEVTHPAIVAAWPPWSRGAACGSLACLPRAPACAACCGRPPGCRLAAAAGLGYAAGSRCAGSRCAGRRCRCCPPGHAPAAGAARQRPAPDPHPAPQAGVGARPGRPRAGPGGQHRRQPRPPASRCPLSSTRSATCSTCPGVFVLGSNDYFAPTLRNPVRYLLPDDGQRNTHTPPLPVAATCATASSDAAGSTSPTGATRSRSTTPRFAVRRRRRPAPGATTTSPPSPGRPTPAADVRMGVDARAVPAGARPVRRRRLRRRARRAHARRPALPARQGRHW